MKRMLNIATALAILVISSCSSTADHQEYDGWIAASRASPQKQATLTARCYAGHEAERRRHVFYPDPSKKAKAIADQQAGEKATCQRITQALVDGTMGYDDWWWLSKKGRLAPTASKIYWKGCPSVTGDPCVKR
jgi:hypothetical protein